MEERKMANQITIDPSEVLSIAGSIASLNDQLEETLKETQRKVQNLSGSWFGQAASTTIDSFNQFANRYYDSYHELLDQYVQFLRTRVAQLYPEVDNAIAKLGEDIQ